MGVNEFYEELFQHWNLKTGQTTAPSSSSVMEIEIPDSDDEGVDLSAIMEVKSDPYEMPAADSFELPEDDPYQVHLEELDEACPEPKVDSMAKSELDVDVGEDHQHLTLEYFDYPEVEVEQVPVDVEVLVDEKVPVVTEMLADETVPVVAEVPEDIPRTMTVQEMDERIRELRCSAPFTFVFFKVENIVANLFRKVFGLPSFAVSLPARIFLAEKQKPATDQSETLPMDPEAAEAAALKFQMDLGGKEPVFLQDSPSDQPSLARSLAIEFKNASSGDGL